MDRRRVAWSVIVLLAVAVVLPAARSWAAGPFTDALSRCLVKNTTDEDKTMLVRWMFAAASTHPGVKDLACVSDEQREVLNKEFAGLIQKLLTETCLDEAREAVQYEGDAAVRASFEVFGRVAGQQLFSAPEVVEGLSGMDQYLDEEAFAKLKETPQPEE